MHKQLQMLSWKKAIKYKCKEVSSVQIGKISQTSKQKSSLIHFRSSNLKNLIYLNKVNFHNLCVMFAQEKLLSKLT